MTGEPRHDQQVGTGADWWQVSEQLRTYAALSGVILNDVTDIDRVAAVVTAELWRVWTGHLSVTDVSRCTPSEVAVVHCILFRVAGNAGGGSPFHGAVMSVRPGRWLTEFERLGQQLTCWWEGQEIDVWCRVVADLDAHGTGLGDLAAAVNDLIDVDANIS